MHHLKSYAIQFIWILCITSLFHPFMRCVPKMNLRHLKWHTEYAGDVFACIRVLV